MKTEINVHPAPDKRKTYPYLGRNIKDRYVVMFTKPLTGVLVAADGYCPWPLGETGDNWVEEEFPPLYGTVVLSNGDFNATN